ncbi:MAG: hypothetical protein LBP59_17020 [Planctomycetaceae bacterium]|jgi:hypothetical protein|nr:hypothetical protein [Planctomycetaceae bacterium]
MNKNIFLFFPAIIVFAIIGCSREIERVGIEGVVTLEGKPAADVNIIITPKAGPGAIVTSGEDGAFKILKMAGPMPGECEIRVEKFDYKTTKGSDGREDIISKPALPEKIQGKSKPFTLKKGDNKIDLDLDKW